MASVAGPAAIGRADDVPASRPRIDRSGYVFIAFFTVVSFAVTVSAELQRRGDLIRLGGAPYLHTLIATVPTAANAAYYAEIVAEKATLRRLV